MAPNGRLNAMICRIFLPQLPLYLLKSGYLTTVYFRQAITNAQSNDSLKNSVQMFKYPSKPNDHLMESKIKFILHT